MDPLVVAAFIAVSFLEGIIPLGLGYFLVKRFRLTWKVFVLGVVSFVLVQVIHTPLVLAMQTPLGGILQLYFSDPVLIVAVYAVILGLLAGLFEEIGRFIVYTRFFPWRKVELSFGNALLFGAGWGGIESMTIGVLVLLNMFAYISAAPITGENINKINATLGGTLTGQQVEAINLQNETLMNLSPFDVFIGLFERIFTIALHLAFSLMVFSAVLGGKKSLLALAILWHAGVDALVVYVARFAGVIMTEGMLFVFALVALAYIGREWKRSANPLPSSR